MSKWLKHYMRFGVRTFWGTVLFSVIALAVAVQLGRAVFPVMHEYRDLVEYNLSKQLRVDVIIGGIQGDWHGLRPKISLENLSIRNPQTFETIFTIESVEVEVGLLSSLRDWRLALRQLSFRGLHATFEQEQTGRWYVKGLPESTANPARQKGELKIDDPLDIFLFGRRINLMDTRLKFGFRSGLEANLTIPSIGLENDADFHRLAAAFELDGGVQALTMTVEGLGDPRDEQNFNANGYVHLDRFPSEQVLAALGIQKDLLVQDQTDVDRTAWQDGGRVNLQLWFTGTAQKGLQWRGSMGIEGVPFIPPANVVWPESFTGDFRGQWDAQGNWWMDLSNAQLNWHDFSAPLSNWRFGGRVNKVPEIRLDRLNLSEWHEVLSRAGFVPSPVKTVFDELKPYGELTQVSIEPRPKEDGYFFLRAMIAKGGVHSWAGVPAIDQVNGLIESTAFDGHVALKSTEGFELNFPRVYHEPLSFREASGDVRWQVNLEEKRVGVSSGILHVAREDVAATGYFNLRLPFQSSPGSEPEMTLVIGVEKGFASLHRTLVPYTVPASLYEWLGRSIKSGNLTDGAFIYHGTLMSESHMTRVLQLSAQADHAEIEFDPNWPALTSASGRLLLDDRQFSVSDLTGTMKGVTIESGHIALRHLGKSGSPAISIQGEIQGDSKKTLALLKSSPVKDLLGEEVASWKLSGDVSGKVKLLVPLERAAQDLSEQDIQIQLQQNHLYIPLLDLSFENVTGLLKYSHLKGINSRKIQATLWDQPIAVQINTDKSLPNKAQINVDFSGQVNVGSLQQWSRRPELRFMTGVTRVNGQLNVPLHSSEPIHLAGNSSLVGVAIDLPEPLDKSPEVPASLEFDLLMEHAPVPALTYRIDLKNKVRSRALIKDLSGKLNGVSVAVGEREPQLKPGQIWLEGTFDRGSAPEWNDAIKRYISYVDDEARRYSIAEDGIDLQGLDPFAQAHTLPVHGKFVWQKLQVDELQFEKVNIALQQQADAWHFDFSGPDLTGEAELYNNSRPLKLNVQHVHLLRGIPLPNPDGSGEVAISGMKNIDLSDLPAANVKVDKWFLRDRDMGEMAFRMRPIAGGVVAYDVYANVQGTAVAGSNGGGELLWLRSDEGDTTYFSGTAIGADIGDMLQFWQLDRALSSKTAQFDFEVQWPGAPDAFTLANIMGVVGFKLERGRFIRGAEVGENPLVKLIGLLNFDTLARRLRLDFSDLHPEGMGYESVQGALLFKQGQIHIPEPLLVDMPASQLQLVGEISVPDEKINAQMVATLPLAGNLTFAAALTGGIPVAVGVFVAGKLFKSQMDKVSSMRYRIRGSWNDPSVKLIKIFDNNTQLPSKGEDVIQQKADTQTSSSPDNPTLLPE